jgi:hypothetical protein
MPVPDFSPGEVLTAAAMDSIGLWKVASASATTGTQLYFSNCFSANYDSYRVIVSDLRATTAVGLDVQIGSGGSAASPGYYWVYVNSSYATTSTYNQQGATNTFAWQTVGVADPVSGGVAIDLFNPFLPRRTLISSDRTDARVAGSAGRFNGFHDQQVSYTDLRLSIASGTFNNITAAVYGYRK